MSTQYNHADTRLRDDHVFQGDPNQFRCSVCGQPRALHERDGFTPGNATSHVLLDVRVRYDGRPGVPYQPPDQKELTNDNEKKIC
jgi:hypothetical protein